MVFSIFDYASSDYSTLPDIIDVDESFQAKKIDQKTFTSIGEIFVKYGVDEIFGLSLIHNHFEMSDDEILVNFGNVSVPWQLSSSEAKLKDVSPTSWRVSTKGLTPYEFVYAPGEKMHAVSNYTAFSDELINTLCELGLNDILGPYALEADDVGIEFTSGRANITLPMDIAEQDGDGMIDTNWAFSKISDGSGGWTVRGSCKKKCKGKPHVKRHISNT